MVYYGAIQLVRTHEGGRGSSKSVCHGYKREVELTYLSTYTKKSLLSYIGVYGDDFHCCAKKHLL